MSALSGYVFGYGSLLDPTSMASTLSGDQAPLSGPAPALLMGYRRVWNVAVPSGPGQRRPLQYLDATPYLHDIACLGIESVPGTACQGAIYGVTADALDRLDEREARYDRVDVSELIHSPAMGLRPGPPDPRGDDRPDDGIRRIGLAGDTVIPIWTYVPKPHVPVRFEQLLAAGQLVVTAHYLRTVERGMRLISELALDDYRLEPVPACPVAELMPCLVESETTDWDGGTWSDEAVG